MNKFDYIIVGAGFAGSVVARMMADNNKKVLIIDKRQHIAGNMYECFDENGVRIHLFGPHIFHTNSDKVFDFLKKYSDFYKYEHKVVGRIEGKIVPIPFNFKSLELLFDKEKAEEIKTKLKENFNQEKVSILDLINHDNVVIRDFGNYVYKNVFENYTAKQWEIDIKDIDKSVINRVPVVLGYDDRYFNDKIQYMPTEGYTKLFENLLDHNNITCKLNSNAKDIISFDNDKVFIDNVEYNGKIIFTGAIDELLNYKYGQLPYRSLNLVFENYKIDYFQDNSVVNYPNEEKYTRITEFKYLTNQILKNKTTILKEYPLKYDVNDQKCKDPFYPILDSKNYELYEKYKNEIGKYKNIYLCGRLAEYKYYNMDLVIERALQLSEILIEGEIK
ncbi:MAG: UDP-galactopyranose mutase [Clostridia bacterium]|nr:UDP-galactopyranose mutase [Clostridia bacterium]MDD4386831.1 UDP-galactopyranose mutase [Clostridia bacterium]